MRVREGKANLIYSNWLSQLSYLPQHQGTISIPDFIPLCTTIYQPCANVFPATIIRIANSNPPRFVGRAILAMRNDTIAAINQKVLHEISDTECKYYFINESESIGMENGKNELPVEYLHSLNPASLPHSKFKLKIGAPVILLRNLCTKEGLCNGTRMTITHIKKLCIAVQMLGGQF